MRRTFVDETVEPPISQVRVKPHHVMFPVCPRCKRENGKAYYAASEVWGEKIVFKQHKSIFDCIKSLWHAPYKNSLPIEVAKQPSPGVLTWMRQILFGL